MLRPSVRIRPTAHPRTPSLLRLGWGIGALAIAAFALTGCDAPEADPEPSDPAAVPPAEVQRLAEEARARLDVNEGGRLVLRAIEAHGGLEAWYRAPTSSYT